MGYGRLKAQESALTDEIDDLIKKAACCDAEEDHAYKQSNGYSIPEDLVFKQKRLEKIQAAKEALEKREATLNPGQPIEEKKQISFAVMGQHAYHPRHIASILIYAYSHGVFSSREIQQKCAQDLAFMHISQMNCPNFRVLGDYRKNNLNFFHDCFKQSVKLALELKMASLGHISLDGSKFKASTSKHKAMSYGLWASESARVCID